MFMIFPNHANTCHNDSQFFYYCHTSVVTVVIKSTLGVTLVIAGHEAVKHKLKCCSFVMVDQYC